MLCISEENNLIKIKENKEEKLKKQEFTSTPYMFVLIVQLILAHYITTWVYDSSDLYCVW